MSRDGETNAVLSFHSVYLSWHFYLYLGEIILYLTKNFVVAIKIIRQRLEAGGFWWVKEWTTTSKPNTISFVDLESFPPRIYPWSNNKVANFLDFLYTRENPIHISFPLPNSTNYRGGMKKSRCSMLQHSLSRVREK